jgi:hypothetical protein
MSPPCSGLKNKANKQRQAGSKQSFAYSSTLKVEATCSGLKNKANKQRQAGSKQSFAYASTLKVEATCSSETPVQYVI